MLVPFISCEPRKVQFGTDVMAPPGALMLTPSAPSCLHDRRINIKTENYHFLATKYVAAITVNIHGYDYDNYSGYIQEGCRDKKINKMLIILFFPIAFKHDIKTLTVHVCIINDIIGTVFKQFKFDFKCSCGVTCTP